MQQQTEGRMEERNLKTASNELLIDRDFSSTR